MGFQGGERTCLGWRLLEASDGSTEFCSSVRQTENQERRTGVQDIDQSTPWETAVGGSRPDVNPLVTRDPCDRNLLESWPVEVP